MLASLASDLRLAARSLFARPGFTLVAVLTLAIGVGANTAIFSVVNRVLLHPMPFDGGDRLVYPWRASPDGRMAISPSRDAVAEWAAHARSLEGVAPFGSDRLVLAAGDEGVELRAGLMTDALPRLLRVRPALGRTFAREELVPSGPAVAMLGYGLWKSRFGGAADVVGRTITLDGRPRTVVGVMPREMDLALGLLGDHDVWLPLAYDPKQLSVNAVAKLRAGVDPAAAQRELQMLGARFDAGRAFFKGWSVKLARPGDDFGAQRTTLLVMMGAVCLVLLVACANVANLVLVRAAGRRRELAIRAALGAARARLFQQLFVESVLLALLGGAAGLLVAMWGVDAIVALRPESLVELEAVTIDRGVLLFGLGAALLSGLLFGLAPALRAAAPDLGETLKSGSAGATRDGRRFRATLVSAEVALSVVLLVGAGLLARSFAKLQRVDVGYDTAGLLSAHLQMPESRYQDTTARRAATEQLAARLARIPGVTASLVAASLPPESGIMFGEPDVEGRVLTDEEKASAHFSPIQASPDVFRVLGVPIVEGRPFATGGREVVVSQSLARRFWPGQSALGRRFRLGRAGDYWTVVGVAREILPFGRRGDEATMQVYMPGDGGLYPTASILLRTGGDPLALVPALRAAAASVDRALVLRDLGTVRAQLAKGVQRERFNMALLTTFAALALLLSAVGLYGVLSYAVAQRTREIGIRMALGARAGGIVRLVVAQAMRLSLAGAAVGAVASLAFGRVLASLLYEVPPRDPVTLAAVLAVVLVTSLAAALTPARRAARVDPAEAMRAD